MKAEEDEMSDTLSGGHNHEERGRDGHEIPESPAESSPEMHSGFQAASMQRRSSLPVSIDSLPRNYRRFFALQLFPRLSSNPYVQSTPFLHALSVESSSLFSDGFFE